MTKEQWINLLERAAWTFVECFLGALCLTGTSWKTAVIAAVGAGLSGVKTFAVEYITKYINEKNKKATDDGVSINQGEDQ